MSFLFVYLIRKSTYFLVLESASSLLYLMRYCSVVINCDLSISYPVKNRQNLSTPQIKRIQLANG